MTDTIPAVRITDEMIEAGRMAFERSGFQNLDSAEIARNIGDGVFSDIHRAMLAAAPVAPGGEDEWSELEKLADAATPGEWRIPSEDNNPFTDGRHVFASGLDGTNFVVANLKTDQTFVTATSREQQQHNAAFIAAANPATIKRLIAALRARSEPEAGAVAWRRRRKGTEGSDGWIMCPLKPERDREFDLQPLYTHPAPSDASATERMRDALRQIADGLPGVRTPHRFASARDIARAALGEA